MTNTLTTKQVWQRVKQEIHRISPEIYDHINPPASHADIAHLEQTLNVTLPSAFVDYLSVMNGQRHEQMYCLLDYYPFMPINEIIEDWQMMNELFLEFNPINIITENKIKPHYWSKNWIPFANFEASNRLILDLDAGKNGCDGQVFVLTPGADLESDEVVVAHSFESFSQQVLDVLASNRFEVVDDVIVTHYFL